MAPVRAESWIWGLEPGKTSFGALAGCWQSARLYDTFVGVVGVDENLQSVEICSLWLMIPMGCMVGVVYSSGLSCLVYIVLT